MDRTVPQSRHAEIQEANGQRRFRHWCENQVSNKLNKRPEGATAEDFVNGWKTMQKQQGGFLSRKFFMLTFGDNSYGSKRVNGVGGVLLYSTSRRYDGIGLSEEWEASLL